MILEKQPLKRVLTYLPRGYKLSVGKHTEVMKIEEVLSSNSKKPFLPQFMAVLFYCQEQDGTIDGAVIHSMKGMDWIGVRDILKTKLKLLYLVLPLRALRFKFFDRKANGTMSVEEFVGVLEAAVEGTCHYTERDGDVYICITKN